MSMAIVTLKKGEGRTLKAGGAWIYDNEIESIMGNAENGEIVLVHDFDGYPLGRGFINRNSKIRVRMMTRHIDQEIDREFLKMRVKNAWDYRKTTVDTSSCRVIFGEADFLPGLVVDKYEDVLVVECLALGMEAFKETIVELLKEVLAEDGIVIRGVYERSDANERKKEGLPKVKDFIGAPFDTDVEITENGVHYQVDVVNGQKTGFFLDQKYNRLAIQRLCRGKRVLDCFTHMGTFALNAGIAFPSMRFNRQRKMQGGTIWRVRSIFAAQMCLMNFRVWQSRRNSTMLSFWIRRRSQSPGRRQKMRSRGTARSTSRD